MNTYYDKPINAVIFKYYDGKFECHLGYVDPKWPRVFRMTKERRSVQICKDPGQMHNHFIWYWYEGGVETIEEMAVKALKLFKTNVNQKLHALEKKIDQCISDERSIDECLKEMGEEV